MWVIRDHPHPPHAFAMAAEPYEFRIHGRLTAAQMRGLSPLVLLEACDEQTILWARVRDPAELQGYVRRLAGAGVRVDAIRRSGA
jgi:hypothetical protein